MSIIARTGLRASRQFQTSAFRQQTRGYAGHIENTAETCLPVNLKNKYTLAVKMVIYAGLGFGTPFYAAYWHLQKASG